MGRGLLAGTFWGLVVGAMIVVAASQFSERRALSLPQPEAEPVRVPAGTEFDQARPETEPVAPATLESRPSDAAQAIPPAPEAEAAPQAIDTGPLAQPSRSEAAPTGPSAPQAGDAPTAASTGDSLPTTGTAPAIPAPTGDTAPSEPRAAAQAPSRARSLDAPAAAPAPDNGTAPALTQSAPAPSGSPAAPSALAAPAGGGEAAPKGDAPARPDTLAAVTAPGASAEAADSPRAPSVASTLPSVTAPAAPSAPALEIAALPGASANPPAQPMPETPRAETGASEPPATPAPAGVPVQDSVLEVPTPSVSDDAALPRIIRPESAPLTEDEQTADIPPEPEGTDPRAIIANAMDFEADPDSGLVALVLVHSGNLPPSPDQIAALPPEVGFAVDAALPAARAIAQAYRAQGREVVAIPDLSSGAQADAVVASFDTVPGAVAIMDDPETGFATDSGTLSSLIATVSATGHGFIAHPRGLNSAQKAADRDGVPARLVFRTVDANAQSDDAIRRLLDQATFRARQEGSVVITVHSDLSSLAAVVEWALANRTGQVMLAPVSAALLVD